VSAETDFRAVLAAAVAVTTLVGTRIAANAVQQGVAKPFIAFSSAHELDLALDNTVLGDKVTFSVECWGETAASAAAVADAAEGALRAAGYVVTARSTGYDADLGLDATVLTVERWA
jgi:hypothetical protein